MCLLTLKYSLVYSILFHGNKNNFYIKLYYPKRAHQVSFLMISLIDLSWFTHFCCHWLWLYLSKRYITHRVLSPWELNLAILGSSFDWEVEKLLTSLLWPCFIFRCQLAILQLLIIIYPFTIILTDPLK